ncbi:hypothetical protein I7I51_05099 [Histoplasma capsulatum]|uniref:Uncharacterized protein n=1 Tax=Ajellomyces capsulatus TaxID=5037 RepID=A0A8A1M752_AJECA|nr:hypothetical protein I7I51_05099 [Histoplasma capsulatum]
MIETWVESDGWVCVDRWEDVKRAHTYFFDELMANMEDDNDPWHKRGKGYPGIEQARLRCEFQNIGTSKDSGICQCSGGKPGGSLWPGEDHDSSTMMDTQENTGMYGLQSMKHSRKAYNDIDESVEWACLKRLKRLLHTLEIPTFSFKGAGLIPSGVRRRRIRVGPKSRIRFRRSNPIRVGIEDAMKASRSSCDTSERPVKDESEEDSNPSPLSILMPTFTANSTITLTAADLMAFCQRLISARQDQNYNTPADNSRYERDVRASINTKAVTTFDGTDYQTWRNDILVDAEVIGGIDILTKNQEMPPEYLSALEKERWLIRKKILFRRMLQSLTGLVRPTIGTLELDNAAALWRKIAAVYGISLAEERLNIIKELTTLHVKNNNYLLYERRFRYLVARHKELAGDPIDIYHDLFLIGLRNYQKAFVQTHLDKFYATGQDPISNINIDDLMKQLANRADKPKGF